MGRHVSNVLLLLLLSKTMKKDGVGKLTYTGKMERIVFKVYLIYYIFGGKHHVIFRLLTDFDDYGQAPCELSF